MNFLDIIISIVICAYSKMQGVVYHEGVLAAMKAAIALTFMRDQLTGAGVGEGNVASCYKKLTAFPFSKTRALSPFRCLKCNNYRCSRPLNFYHAQNKNSVYEAGLRLVFV